jgi:NADH/NAD ratio-sensing transcriptional regulator Rex
LVFVFNEDIGEKMKTYKTKYHEVALKMANEYKELRKLEEENNGKIPSKKLSELYNIDSAAAREIYIGLWAMKEVLNKN